MIASHHERNGARLGDLADLPVDHRVAALDPGRRHVRVPGVDDREHVERQQPTVVLEGMKRARRVVRLADGSRGEPGT